MDRITRFVGLDTSKDSIAVGIADDGRERGRHWGAIENAPEKVRRLMENLGPKEELLVCYEAGPTGYGLYRQLTRMGIRCIVVAPALIPKRPGDRVKTDRRDAVRLAEASAGRRTHRGLGARRRGRSAAGSCAGP